MSFQKRTKKCCKWNHLLAKVRPASMSSPHMTTAKQSMVKCVVELPLFVCLFAYIYALLKVLLWFRAARGIRKTGGIEVFALCELLSAFSSQRKQSGNFRAIFHGIFPRHLLIIPVYSSSNSEQKCAVPTLLASKRHSKCFEPDRAITAETAARWRRHSIILDLH